jgi:type II secretory pathway pseudopilin PulG
MSGTARLHSEPGKRAAKTLLEVVIIVSIMSVALTLAATTLVTLFRVERQIQTSQMQRQTLTRLGSRLRSDAHAALSVKTDKGCELSLAGGRKIQYLVVAPDITRELRDGEEVLHRDAFVLPSRAQATFTMEGKSEAPLVCLAITPGELPGRAHQAATRSATIVAAVNLPRPAPVMEAAP